MSKEIVNYKTEYGGGGSLPIHMFKKFVTDDLIGYLADYSRVDYYTSTLEERNEVVASVSLDIYRISQASSAKTLGKIVRSYGYEVLNS